MLTLCVMTLLLAPPQCISVWPDAHQCWIAADDWVAHIRAWEDRSRVHSSAAVRCVSAPYANDWEWRQWGWIPARDWTSPDVRLQ